MLKKILNSLSWITNFLKKCNFTTATSRTSPSWWILFSPPEAAVWGTNSLSLGRPVNISTLTLQAAVKWERCWTEFVVQISKFCHNHRIWCQKKIKVNTCGAARCRHQEKLLDENRFQPRAEESKHNVRGAHLLHAPKLENEAFFFFMCVCCDDRQHHRTASTQ